MFRTMVKTEGMMCGMCEKHIDNAINRKFAPKSVNSSSKTGETEIISETAPEESAMREVIEKEGYKFISMTSEPYEKKKFSLFGKK